MLVLANRTIMGVILMADSGVFEPSPKIAYSVHRKAQEINNQMIPKGSIRLR
ncbi:hypothetical protein [Winogradskyella sp.]